jgi:hypothetical protein
MRTLFGITMTLMLLTLGGVWQLLQRLPRP